MSQPAPFDRSSEYNRRVVCHAPAKINLALHVTGQRPDGYHELETLVVFCDTGDRIDVGYAPLISAGKTAVHAIGPFADALPGTKDNIAFSAACALSPALKKLDGGLDITLEKVLPVASGMGGGSADAAATLIALARFCNEPVGSNLTAIAAGLGSDVPMCLFSRPLIARGRGEEIEPVQGFPGLHLVLVNPGVSVSTPQVFSALETKTNAGLPALPENLSTEDILSWLDKQRNDLQAPALSVAPQIADVLGEIESCGAALSRMSGSGATCFGVFSCAEKAEDAALHIRKNRPDWWVKSTRTRTFGRDRAIVIDSPANLPFDGDSKWIQHEQN